jgi:Bacterial Ig domain
MRSPGLAVVLAFMSLIGASCAGGMVDVREDCSVLGDNQGADHTAPVVRFLTPADGVSLSGTAILSASVTDECGVSKVRFVRSPLDSAGGILGDAIVAGDGKTYILQWDTRQVANGSYALEVFGYDSHLGIDHDPEPNTAVDSRQIQVAN